MLSKVGSLFIEESRLKTLQRISKVLFLVAVIVFFAFPFLSEKIYITEKIMRQTSMFSNHLTSGTFQKSMTSFFEKLKNINRDLGPERPKPKFDVEDISLLFEEFDNYEKELISLEGSNEKVFLVSIDAPRGDQRKSIVVNFVVENSTSVDFYKNKNVFMMYVLAEHFNTKQNKHWMTKDIKLLFTPKELFYEKPEILGRLFKNDHRFLNPFPEYMIHLDLLNDLGNINALVIKASGMNSETSDLDIYTVAEHNFSSDFKNYITSNDQVFSRQTKTELRGHFTSLRNYVLSFLFKNHPDYSAYPGNFVYFLEFLLDNFLRVNHVDFNSYIISEKGVNSFFVKARVSEEKKPQQESLLEVDKKSQSKNFGFLLALERILISLSLTEIMIFRGEKNYILCSPTSLVGVGRFIFVPVLCVLILFYQIMVTFTTTDFKKSKEFLVGFLILVSLGLYMFLEIGTISNLARYLQVPIRDESYFTYLVIAAFQFFIFVTFFAFQKASHNSYKIFLTMIKFFIALNSFLIFFINYGFGLVISYAIHLLEIIYYEVDERFLKTHRIKYQVLKIVANIGIQYLVLVVFKNQFDIIVSNYLKFFNNPYFCTSLIHMYLLIHLAHAVVAIFKDYRTSGSAVTHR